jgi:RNA polymerase sigma-70 factor (ECF subfamily)
MIFMEAPDRRKRLLAEAQGGDRAAFGVLLEDLGPRLEALIASRLGPGLRETITAADVLQETFLQGFRSLASFQWQGEESFLRWLGGIAEHVMRKESRRQDRAERLRIERALDPAHGGGAREPPSPSRAQRREERFDRLQGSLEKLSPEHRQVILLSRIEGLPAKEVAARMGRSETAVRNLLLRALRELQRAFGETESLSLPPRTLGERDTP